ncbi:hypothetical protein OIU84_028032 [Salix udensis]|uniref:Uncharacterized protein n=1 Tax=Salix udensis TaxID=889485 RepID=A0AAD6KDV3_9ROSI|nr:hypothetical protein OIU84_028032 [Salix udensis]
MEELGCTVLLSMTILITFKLLFLLLENIFASKELHRQASPLKKYTMTLYMGLSFHGATSTLENAEEFATSTVQTVVNALVCSQGVTDGEFVISLYGRVNVEVESIKFCFRGGSCGYQIISEVHTTPVPPEVKDLVGKLVTNCESDGEARNHDEKRRLLSNKPMVAVGAGATAIFRASSVSKVVHASTFMKVATFKFPTSLKLLLIQTQKIMAISMGKTLGPTKLMAPGLVNSGANATSALKAAASAEKIRTVVHSVIASAEKISFSTMRTAFYEIMRQRQVQSIGVLPWATFGCSVATCSALLMYGDGIECAVESLPAAPSIASLSRGIQSLHQASQVVGQTDGTRIQKSIESLMNRLRKVKMQ